MARVLFFGRLSDAAGTEELLIPLPAQAQHVSDLKLLLVRLHPELGGALEDPTIRVAINQKFAARQGVVEALSTLDFGSRERFVRLNALKAVIPLDVIFVERHQ